MRNLYHLAAVLLASGSLLCASAAEIAPIPMKGAISKTPASRIDESQWKHVGTGKFSDPLLCNVFYGFYNDEIDVEVYESTSEPGVFRIENPWPTATENADRNFMVVDASHPEYVRVREGLSPVEDKDFGLVYFESMTEFVYRAFIDRMPDKTDEEIVAASKEQMETVMGSLVVTMKDGYIEFPQNCFGVRYPNGDGYEHQANKYEPTSGHYSGYLTLPGSVAQTGWKHLGTGTIFDGFLAPVFGEEPEERDIEVYEHEEFPGVYRIENAIKVKEGEFAPFVVDASDPNFVKIPEVDTRIVTKPFGPLSILSVSSQYESYEAMVLAMPESADRNITYSDGVIDIPAMSIYLYFPAYNNTEMVAHEDVIRSFITIPDGSGVEGVEASEDVAPEYYDLQGMRLREPVKGQLTIVRRGSKVSKTIIK